jgi:hypothetical protein
MKIRLSLTLTFALSMLVTGVRADTVVYNTLGPASPDDGWISGSGLFGIPFSPSTTVNLTSLTGQWYDATEPLSVSLWSSDAGGQPATELESWTTTISDEVANYTLVSTTNPLLTAGQTYWVEAQAPVDPTNGFSFLFWGIDVDTPTGGVYIGDSPTDWSAAFPDDGAAALEVQGTVPSVAPTPESSSVLLLASGLLAFGMLYWRRRGWVTTGSGSGLN